MPNILKKRLHELKISSILLFSGVVILVLMFGYRVLFTEPTEVGKPHIQRATKESGILDSLAIIITSYGFVINFFPVYQSIDRRSNGKATLASFMALIFCFIVYIFFSFMAWYVYGDTLHANIFDNIQKEDTFSSIFIRSLFLLIFICNIPFLFLPGKEAMLIMIDEYMTCSMSI